MFIWQIDTISITTFFTTSSIVKLKTRLICGYHSLNTIFFFFKKTMVNFRKGYLFTLYVSHMHSGPKS